METRPIRILLADDHNLVRSGIAQLLAREPDLEVVGEAADGFQAYAIAVDLQPDLILMDLAMPGSSGFDAIERIREDVPGAITVVLTYSADEKAVAEALRRGARGYLLKSLEPHTLAGHVRAAVRGEVPMSPEVTRTMAPGASLGASLTAGTQDASPQISRRELEILALVADGATNREIALRLALAENTVKDHLKHILAKFQVENRAQAVAMAFRVGVLVR